MASCQSGMIVIAFPLQAQQISDRDLWTRMSTLATTQIQPHSVYNYHFTHTIIILLNDKCINVCSLTMATSVQTIPE